METQAVTDPKAGRKNKKRRKIPAPGAQGAAQAANFLNYRDHRSNGNKRLSAPELLALADAKVMEARELYSKAQKAMGGRRIPDSNPRAYFVLTHWRKPVLHADLLHATELQAAFEVLRVVNPSFRRLRDGKYPLSEATEVRQLVDVEWVTKLLALAEVGERIVKKDGAEFKYPWWLVEKFPELKARLDQERQEREEKIRKEKEEARTAKEAKKKATVEAKKATAEANTDPGKGKKEVKKK